MNQNKIINIWKEKEPKVNKNIIEQMKQLRQLEKQKQNNKSYDIDLLKEQNIQDKSINNTEIKLKFEQSLGMRNKEKKINQILDTTGKNININNIPYKQIITNKEYGGEDYKKKHSKETFHNDITVHKVSEKDKDIDEFIENLSKKIKKIKKHNKKLKKLYSSDNKIKHKQKYEYRKVQIYNQYTDTNTNYDHTNTKQDRIKFYEKQQEQWNNDNLEVSNLMANLKNKGLLTEDIDLTN